MTKDFKWPHWTYYVETTFPTRMIGRFYINGPGMIPDSTYGDVILTPKGIGLQQRFRNEDFPAFAVSLTHTEADELVRLLGVTLEAFFRK